MAGIFGAPPELSCLPLLIKSAMTLEPSHLQQSLNLSSFVECIVFNVIRIGILYVKPSS